MATEENFEIEFSEKKLGRLSPSAVSARLTLGSSVAVSFMAFKWPRSCLRLQKVLFRQNWTNVERVVTVFGNYSHLLRTWVCTYV
jgi:hypothetical protein